MTDINYRPREIAAYLGRALTSLPVVVVTGLRQSGKTTLLRMDPVTRDRRYLTSGPLAQLRRSIGAGLPSSTP